MTESKPKSKPRTEYESFHRYVGYARFTKEDKTDSDYSNLWRSTIRELKKDVPYIPYPSKIRKVYIHEAIIL